MSEKCGSESRLPGSQSTKEDEMTEEEERSRKLTRRDFVKGAAAVAGVGALASCAPAASPAPAETPVPCPTCPPAEECAPCPTPWLPEKWDEEADVVVVGTGLAGLATAVAAYDAGASVLILEKLPEALEGGNSRVSGNAWWAPDDVDEAVKYINACNQGRVEDESIPRVLAQGLKDNNAWIEQLGGTFRVGASTGGVNPTPSWPMLPGSSTVGFYNLDHNGEPTYGGGFLWQLFRDHVTERGITVLYETPATELIQDGNARDILGVKADSKGTEVTIKANKAVVLACGGFEFNEEMIKQYLPTSPIIGWGCPGNTGDGIKMAEAVGADLWHMQQQNAGQPRAMITPLGPVGTISIKGNAHILVDRQGNRYVDEKGGWGSYGFPGWQIAMWFDRPTAAFLRNPSWDIFDETARVAGPLYSKRPLVPPGGWPAPYLNYGGWFGFATGHDWSDDNSAEVEAGWIVKGDTIADLAAKIAPDPDNEGPTGHLMDAATVEASVSRWNDFSAAGEDADFHRPAETLAPIQEPPFYAVKLWVGYNNTEGGPKRNSSCQVLNPLGQPIPRLYGTGELGSFYGMLYNGGGNIGECMLTGRIAGEHAASLDPWE
jgi:succinate dehydrogenase/fumarate reductase flavoprotein subunit